MHKLSKLHFYDNHKMIFDLKDYSDELNGFIAIHRGNNKHPSFGATRVWNYRTEGEALEDALRLSRTMSYKSIMAGLKYGGAKGVVKTSKSKRDKSLLYKYAEVVNSLEGRFITGADVGVSRDDVKTMRRKSPYFVGTKTDPVRYTALGIYYSMLVAMGELDGRESLEGKSVAIQGVGKVGRKLLELIYPYVSKVYVADIDKKRLNFIKDKFTKVNIMGVDDIYKQDVDIYSPNALSNCVRKEILKELKAKAIVGGANGQLDEANTGDKLFKMGVLYAPDYVVNAGGLIAVVDEYENGTHRVKRVSRRVEKIADQLKKVIKKSKKSSLPTNRVSDQMAEEIFNKIS